MLSLKIKSVKSKICISYVMQWIAGIMVCTTCIAYDQVEIPRRLYILMAYGLGVIYFFLSLRYKSKYYIYLTIPLCNVLINLIWAVAFGAAIDFGFLTLITVSEVLILSKSSKIWVYNCFRTYTIIIATCGIICYFSFLLNLGLPFTIKNFYSGTDSQWYINYHISYIYFQNQTETSRLCGLYNEPGYFGTIAAFILIIEQFNLKRIGNIVILFAGLLTLSFAFCLLIMIYLFIRYRKSRTIIGVIFILILAVTSVKFLDTNDGPASRLIDRFSIEDGKFKGDNRIKKNVEDAIDSMFDSYDFIIGMGPEAFEKLGLQGGNAGLKVYFFKYGLLGFSILWGLTLVMTLMYANWDRRCYLFIVLFFISTYQRCTFVTSDYMCLLFCGIDYIRNINNSFLSGNKVLYT